jgi:hypothetical protein
MRLTGLQIQELRDIILQAFPTEAQLEAAINAHVAVFPKVADLG